MSERRPRFWLLDSGFLGFFRGRSSRPPDATDSPDVTSYYDLPVLKKPVWHWEVWLYFFLGGIAAGSYVVASLATLFGGPRARLTERTGYVLSFLVLLTCPLLLIKDLGRPRLFLNMLRVFKPSSPMSMGVWSLVAFSGFSALAFLREVLLAVGGPLAALGRRIPQRTLAPLGAGGAGFLASYTGVLLSVTSVPLWSKSFLLAPSFLAASLSAAISALTLILSAQKPFPRDDLARLEPLKHAALIAEAAALAGYLAMEGEAATPLLTPNGYGRQFLGGAVGLGILVPLVLGQTRLARGRGVAIPALLSLLGSLALRYSVVMAGHLSAGDAKGYLRWTREER